MFTQKDQVELEEVMDEHRLFALKEEMEKAEARKLQPYFIRSFFAQAFERRLVIERTASDDRAERDAA
jgi:hypothetical protein